MQSLCEFLGRPMNFVLGSRGSSWLALAGYCVEEAARAGRQMAAAVLFVCLGVHRGSPGLDWLPRQTEGQSSIQENTSFDPRPSFHFTPPSGWMNDPNGLSFVVPAGGGRPVYHLFYRKASCHHPSHAHLPRSQSISLRLVVSACLYM